MSAQARSFELPPELADELEIAADQLRRPIGEMLEAAVRRFLDDESEVLRKVEAARVSAVAGNTVPWDEAVRGFRETIARVSAARADG